MKFNRQPFYGSIPEHSIAVEDEDGNASEEYSVPIHCITDDDLVTGTASTTSSESMRSVWDLEDGDGIYNRDTERGSTSQPPPISLDDGVAAWIFWLLGFESNPLESTSQTRTGNTRNSAGADLRLSMLSNYSTAYNVVSISLALNMMTPLYTYTTPSDKSLCSSALIAGMIIGQLTGGAMGDLLGRHMAMTFVMLLQVFASFASAFSFDVMPESSGDAYLSSAESLLNGVPSARIYYSLAAFRFILGLGCGGVYPLAATLTAESSSSEEDRGKLVALTFSMQGLGSLSVPIVALFLMGIFGDNSDYAWRCLLGFGCIPGAALTVLRLKRMVMAQMSVIKKPLTLENATSPGNAAKPVPKTDTILDSIKAEKDLIPKLLGTAGCWFLFDILFYGNTLFQPIVLSAAFGDDETVATVARDTLFIAALALPGYIVSIIVVGKLSPRIIQMQGFMIMAVLFALIGFYFESLSGDRWLLLSLYGSTFFFSNFGPNSTTYMLPSMTFSRPCRATLNGFCAASGKAGALIGALLFATGAARFGNGPVMLFCSAISLVSFVLTWFCVSPVLGDQNKEKLAISEEKPLMHERKPSLTVVLSVPSLFDYYHDADNMAFNI